MVQTIRRRSKNPVAWALVAALCATSLVFAGWGAAQYRRVSAQGPLLVSPVSLISAGDGLLYCADVQGRVHRYTSDGEGRGAWATNAPGKGFHLAVNADGGIDVAVEQSGERLSFSPVGQLLERVDDPGAFERFRSAQLPDTQSADEGARFEIIDEAIVRLDGDTSVIIVPRIPFPLTLYAWAPWTLVLSLGLSTLGLLAAIIMPWRAEPGPR